MLGLARTLATILVLALASPAHADPAAEQAFLDGRALLKQGKLDEACTLFQRSQDLEAKVGTLLNLADCRERQGRIATAWELFVQMKALAIREKDDRAALAGERADALVGRRAYLTIVVPPDRRVAGLAIERNGGGLPATSWDVKLPIDPGIYTITATAPGFAPASVQADVVGQGVATVTIPPLVALAPTDAVADLAGSGDPAVIGSVDTPITAGAIDPPLRTGSLGGVVGISHHGGIGVGLRGTFGFPVSGGVVRGVPSLTYTRTQGLGDETDDEDITHAFTLAIGLDYVWAWRAGFASAGGLGFGVDYTLRPYDPNITPIWIAPRLSPLIVRLARPHLELGVHSQLVVPTQGKVTLLTALAVDWFVW